MESEIRDDDSSVVIDEVKLGQIVAEGSLHFDDWTSLISEIEKTFPDNIEKICLVYDSFLSAFPLCYGYWRKYADHKMRLCTVEKVVEVFERSVLSVTYCVDMWVDYCNFGRLAFEDQSDVRRLFKRAISFVGKDYLCHTLWDRYIEFEFSLKNWSSLAHIYIQALKFPTKKLHGYYDKYVFLI
ncbi:Pre-mRNA-processing factor 39-2 [Euphorbia peplus]|nr:Pre-mRNA-processing factor 39-2 [Euphorbia peplus]